MTDSPHLTAFREGFPRFAELFNAGEFERLSANFSEDFEQRFPEGFPEPSVNGGEAWARFFSEYRQAFATWELSVLESFDAGPRQVIAHTRYVGLGNSSGVATTSEYWDLIEYDNQSRIRYFNNCGDRATAEATAAARRGE